MEERRKIGLTGLLLANLVLMFLPWFGKGELVVLGVEVLLNPVTVAGVLVFMLGLWWRPAHPRLTCLAGTLAVLAGEGYAFFFWPSLTIARIDPGFSLRFARFGFYLGLASTLVLLAACLLCRLEPGKAPEREE